MSEVPVEHGRWTSTNIRQFFDHMASGILRSEGLQPSKKLFQPSRSTLAAKCIKHKNHDIGIGFARFTFFWDR